MNKDKEKSYQDIIDDLQKNIGFLRREVKCLKDDIYSSAKIFDGMRLATDYLRKQRDSFMFGTQWRDEMIADLAAKLGMDNTELDRRVREYSNPMSEKQRDEKIEKLQAKMSAWISAPMPIGKTMTIVEFDKAMKDTRPSE